MRRLVLSVALVVSFSGSAFAQSTGRYARGAGESIGTMKAGTESGDLGYKPYSASYLPRYEGPLAKENDAEIKRQIQNGYGDCDLVHQIIKDNANKDTAAKFDTATDNANAAEANRPLDPFREWLIRIGWMRDPRKSSPPSNLRETYLREGFDPNAETWTGFCHNWAPAGLDPVVNFTVSMDKIYADVPFGIGDMRELATWTFPGGNDHAWFGKRHNDKDSKEAPEDEMDPVDVLTILRNYVGEGKPGIVFDVDPGYMVWNQPVHKWNMNSTEVTGADAGPKTPPPGGKALKVDLTFTYGVEGNYGYRGDGLERSQGLKGWIYTDASGKIVDSAWAPGQKVPDFAWVNKDLKQSKEFERLKKIANEGISVGDIKSFCETMQGLPSGPISSENAAKLRGLLDKICPVLDQNKINDYIRKTAERTGQDFTALDDAIRSNTASHS